MPTDRARDVRSTEVRADGPRIHDRKDRTVSDYEIPNAFRFNNTQDRYVVHLLWYRHATEPEWIDAECRCIGFVGKDIVAVNALVPIGGDPKVVNTPRGLHRLS